MVLARRRSWDEAEHAFEEALSFTHTVRYPYAEARALYEMGMMHAGRSDARQARERLEEAAVTFRRLGARPYTDLAQKARTGTD